jgi:hypothetical protein
MWSLKNSAPPIRYLFYYYYSFRHSEPDRQTLSSHTAQL